MYGGRRKTAEMEMEPKLPRKWRLILNYQDHTILQYEITRKDAGDEGRAPWEARVLRKQGLEGEASMGVIDADEDEEGEDDWPLHEIT